MKNANRFKKHFTSYAFPWCPNYLTMLPWKKVLYVKIDNIHIDKLTYKQQNGDMKIYVDVSPIYLISYKKYPHIYRETVMHCTTKIL